MAIVMDYKEPIFNKCFEVFITDIAEMFNLLENGLLPGIKLTLSEYERHVSLCRRTIKKILYTMVVENLLIKKRIRVSGRTYFVYEPTYAFIESLKDRRLIFTFVF